MYSLLDFHLSLVNETESEGLAAQALLDLEGSGHANTTQSTDNTNDNENSNLISCVSKNQNLIFPFLNALLSTQAWFTLVVRIGDGFSWPM